MSVLEFQEDGHLYRLDGVVIPSNTQILKSEGLCDDQFYTDEGRERGTRVHNACWYLDEGDLIWDSVAAEERGYVRAYEKFKRESGCTVELIETMLWSRSMFATRIDRGVVLNGRRTLIDLKTGAIQPWIEAQLGGQQIAINERIQAGDIKLEPINGHPYYEDRLSLHLHKDGGYRLIPWRSPDATDIFLAALRLYHWKKSHHIN